MVRLSGDDVELLHAAAPGLAARVDVSPDGAWAVVAADDQSQLTALEYVFLTTQPLLARGGTSAFELASAVQYSGNSEHARVDPEHPGAPDRKP